MMLRPRWILALLLALAIAAAFALLGRWQLERAVASGQVAPRSTETVQPLADVVRPGGPPKDTATGQMVTVDGAFAPADEQLISDRFNGGTSGYWVVSHFVTATGASLPVARGWTADRAQAASVVDALSGAPANRPTTVTGRFVPSEAPVVPAQGRDPHTQTTVSTAAMINLWADFADGPVYAGFVVDTAAPSGLTVIDSPVPLTDAALNWLNIFYALEWVVFAGFAVFLWFRLVRDARERETEQAAIDAVTPG